MPDDPDTESIGVRGRELVDAHVHAPRLATIKPAWLEWADRFSGPESWRDAYDADGNPVPARLDALFAVQGVVGRLARTLHKLARDARIADEQKKASNNPSQKVNADIRRRV